MLIISTTAGDVYLADSQQCWLGGKQVHLGCRLGVLAPLLVNIELKLQSEGSKYTSAIALVYWAWTRGTWAESAN